jgi:hypothetical protein
MLHADRGISTLAFLEAVVKMDIDVITVLGTRASASFAMFVQDPALPKSAAAAACNIDWPEQRRLLEARDLERGKELLRKLGCRVYKTDASNCKQWTGLVDKFEALQQLVEEKRATWAAMELEPLLKDLDKAFPRKDSRASALEFLGLPQSGRAQNQLLRLADALKDTRVTLKPHVICTHPVFPNHIFVRKFTFHGKEACIVAVREHVTSKEIQVLEFFITNPSLIKHAHCLVSDALPWSTFKDHVFAPSQTRHSLESALLIELEKHLQAVVRIVTVAQRTPTWHMQRLHRITGTTAVILTRHVQAEDAGQPSSPHAIGDDLVQMFYMPSSASTAQKMGQRNEDIVANNLRGGMFKKDYLAVANIGLVALPGRPYICVSADLVALLSQSASVAYDQPFMVIEIKSKTTQATVAGFKAQLALSGVADPLNAQCDIHHAMYQQLVEPAWRIQLLHEATVFQVNHITLVVASCSNEVLLRLVVKIPEAERALHVRACERMFKYIEYAYKDRVREADLANFAAHYHSAVREHLAIWHQLLESPAQGLPALHAPDRNGIKRPLPDRGRMRSLVQLYYSSLKGNK